MPTHDELESADPPLPRDELVALIARAHGDAAYGESARAGRTLAAQCKLPKLVAENLGAGFGQWSFFPEASDIVDFAFGYVPPSTEEELWTLARAWAADDAAGRHTLLVLVGREILQHELRRIDVPALRELADEVRPGRLRELRANLGLAVAAGPSPKAARRAPASPSVATPPTWAPAMAPAAEAPAPRAVRAPAADGPARMPKPEFKKPPKAAPPAAAKRFAHPKFGEGTLEAQDGIGPDAKLTLKFDGGSKTLLARYVTEVT
jgi:hypothetical protein